MDGAGVIATHYRIDPARPASQALGGLRAYAVIDQRDAGRALLAIQTRPDLPPRSRLLATRNGQPLPHALAPLDHGTGRDQAGQEGYYILCGPVPGPALTVAPAPWSETEILRCLLLPAAAALDAIAERGYTHRAIRPDNVFRAGPGEPVTLGPFWAAPPACHQPAACEPPYAAMCHPAGRGDGSIADDVYALGVTILWCVLGGALALADDRELTARKLEQGSLAALAQSARLTPGLHDLLSVMLAEEPDHRPPPALLLEPSQARSRRLANRPPQRALRPFEIGQDLAWSARGLALALARQPERAAPLLRTGAVDRWLRRMLGDGAIAVRLEEVTGRRAAESIDEDPRGQVVLVLRAVAILDPLAPLTWRCAAFFPDGLGPLLVAAQGPNDASLSAALEEAVANDAVVHWCALQTKRHDLQVLRQDARDWRNWLTVRGPMGGLRRLLYGLNPLLPCQSPLLGGCVAARLADLLPALEAAAATADRKRLPLDPHVIAFAAARADQTLLVLFGQLEGLAGPAERPAALAFYSQIQVRLQVGPLPRLAGWLLESGAVDATSWRHLPTRQNITRQLAEFARSGQIAPMIALAEDPRARAADRAGAETARQRLQSIELELTQLEAGAADRAHDAKRLGLDIAAGTGLLAAVAAGLALAFAA